MPDQQNCGNDAFFEIFTSFEFVTTSYTILAVVTIPLGFYGIFLIWRITPPKMSRVWIVLLNLQIWTIISDLTICVLFRPVVLFPVIAFYSEPIFEFVHFHIKVQTFLAAVGLSSIGIAIIMVFENRHSTITTIKYRITKKKTRIIFFVSNYLVVIVSQLPYYFGESDTWDNKLEFFQSIPCMSPSLLSKNTHIFTTNVFLLIYLVTGLVFFMMLQIAFFAIQSAYHLVFVRNTTISLLTKKLQQKFLNALMIQVIIPFCYAPLPIFISATSTQKGIYNQALNNILMVTIASHGLLSCLSLIFIHQPYRVYTWNITFGRFEKQRTNDKSIWSGKISTTSVIVK